MALAETLGVRTDVRPVPPGSWDVLVNATPVGTHPEIDQTAFPESRYDGEVAYDLVYNPPRTRFLRDEAAGGCRTIGGLDMLVEQARRQVSGLLDCQTGEIIFTSGGSEANNLAIKGYCLAHADKGRHIIVSAIEHPAVMEVAHYLERQGLYFPSCRLMKQESSTCPP